MANGSRTSKKTDDLGGPWNRNLIAKFERALKTRAWLGARLELRF
jgi:hypothetical protein